MKPLPKYYKSLLAAEQYSLSWIYKQDGVTYTYMRAEQKWVYAHGALESDLRLVEITQAEAFAELL